MDGPGWPASRKKSPLGRSPLLFCLSHLGPGAHDISGDNDGRPRPPPVDASKLSKTHAFQTLCACTKEIAAEWKAPAGLGSKHALFYGCSKSSKTHYFRTLFSLHRRTASSDGTPKLQKIKYFHFRGHPRGGGHRATSGLARGRS